MPGSIPRIRILLRRTIVRADLFWFGFEFFGGFAFDHFCGGGSTPKEPSTRPVLRSVSPILATFRGKRSASSESLQLAETGWAHVPVDLDASQLYREEILVDMAYEIYVGSSLDPTRGALWYHADYVAPKWRKAFLPVRKIGQHIFYLSGAAKNKKARGSRVALDG